MNRDNIIYLPAPDLLFTAYQNANTPELYSPNFFKNTANQILDQNDFIRMLENMEEGENDESSQIPGK